MVAFRRFRREHLDKAQAEEKISTKEYEEILEFYEQGIMKLSYNTDLEYLSRVCGLQIQILKEYSSESIVIRVTQWPHCKEMYLLFAPSDPRRWRYMSRINYRKNMLFEYTIDANNTEFKLILPDECVTSTVPEVDMDPKSLLLDESDPELKSILPNKQVEETNLEPESTFPDQHIQSSGLERALPDPLDLNDIEPKRATDQQLPAESSGVKRKRVPLDQDSEISAESGKVKRKRVSSDNMESVKRKRVTLDQDSEISAESSKVKRKQVSSDNTESVKRRRLSSESKSFLQDSNDSDLET